MLQLKDPGIDAGTTRTLKRYQTEVNSAGNYADRVAKARKLFANRSTPRNATFRVVRNRLRQMCASPDRCGWCEDSEANQIDHVKPKALYPERTFVWENYLPACAVCNSNKGDRFAILGQNCAIDVTRRPDQAIVPPRSGAPALIDPRFEDPLEFLELEMVDTFRFQPKYGLKFPARDRARYTIEVLKLNREVLSKARRNVFEDNLARLIEYRTIRDGGASPADLQIFKSRFLSRPHPTVWREMQRQYELPSLKELFEEVPEVLCW